MIHRTIRLIPTFLLLVLLSYPVNAETKLVFSSTGEDVTLAPFQILKEAYQHLGVDITSFPLPAERSLRHANSGDVDGDLMRMEGLEKVYPNLIRIPVPIKIFEIVVTTKQHFFKVNGWKSLKPYLIGIRIGIKFAESATEGMDVTHIVTNEQLFKMLNLGRVDVVVATRRESLELIDKLQLRHLTILDPPLQELKLYHYLNRKHQAIVPQITRVLQQMETQGRIKELHRQDIRE